jgi:hypothetical protein
LLIAPVGLLHHPLIEPRRSVRIQRAGAHDRGRSRRCRR